MCCDGLLNEVPSRPRVVLRVGFAGRKDLTRQSDEVLRKSLDRVFAIVGHRLAAITRGIPVEAGKEPQIAEFFARECPLLRLVTGLCEGADAAAAQQLEQIEIHPEILRTGIERAACLATELAAVLPFDLKDYRESRPPEFRPEFDREAALCSYILLLDGLYSKPNPDTKLAKDRRAKAYRAQSTALLRHVDLLIAATDPDDVGKAGGTIETMRAALAFELPIVFIDTGNGLTRLIGPGDDLQSILLDPPLSEEALRRELTNLVSKIVADPDIEIRKPGAGEDEYVHSEKFLREYFDVREMPPLKFNTRDEIVPATTRRQLVWAQVENLFSKGRKPRRDDPSPPYAKNRARATSLNYYYSGLYRGAFVINYLLAVAAVFLASLSLVILSVSRPSGPERAHSNQGEQSATQAVTDSASRPNEESSLVWLHPTLLILGLAELVIVSVIAVSVHQAKHEHWSDKAVDYRYLAERLRCLFYLPLVGSFTPPAASPPQYTDRAIHQSAVDWLFGAITRAAPVADLATKEDFPIDGGSVVTAKVLRLKPLDAVTAVRSRWVTEQVAYHSRASRTMERLYNFTAAASKYFAIALICVVVADVTITVLELMEVHGPASVTPYLLCFDAVVPALLAALNGIRFQSECHRLAERSAILRTILGGHSDNSDEFEPALIGGRWKQADGLITDMETAQCNSNDDIGAWSLQSLRLAERIAQDVTREAAEWSVLYAKELPET